MSLSIGAGLVVVTGGVLLYSLTGLSPTLLAAQLTLDHLSCFATHSAVTPVDERAGEQQYARDYGWPIDLPERIGQPAAGRRAALFLWRRRGGSRDVSPPRRPVSLYIIPDADGARATADVFGHDAVIWSSQGTHVRAVGKRVARFAGEGSRQRSTGACKGRA